MEIWKKIEGETDRAYNAFCVYKKLGKLRTIIQASELLQTNPKNLYRLSGKFNWKARANAFDSENTDSESGNNNDSLIILEEKQLEQSVKSARILQNFIEQINKKIENSKEYIDELELNDLIKLSNSLSKAMPETLKALKMLYTSTENQKDSNKFLLLKIIRNDDKALEIALKLLERVDEVYRGSD